MSDIEHQAEKRHRLAFLISQPRAGSSLLQRMLVRHPAIFSASEAWIMLKPLFGLQAGPSGTRLPYNAEVEHLALRGFLDTLPESEASYYRACRRMYGHLYREALEHNGGSVYLDKTPRYYEVATELIEVFPEGRFVFLFRNPLAVLRSIWRTFGASQWTQLQQFRRDLLLAPARLIQAVEKAEAGGLSVKYEDLVREPEKVLSAICTFLDLPFAETMLRYGDGDLSRWPLGDPGIVYRKKEVDSAHADLWMDDLKNPQFWRACKGYLELIGPEITQRMGYDFDELTSCLEAHRPSWLKSRVTVSFATLIQEDPLIESRTFGRRVKCGLATRAWGERS